MNKKLLIIPSWYPTNKNPVLGIFFREQALLFKDDYQIKILFGKLTKNISRFQKIYNTLKYLFFHRVNPKKIKNYFIEPPEVFSFSFSQGINLWRKQNHYLKIEGYVKYFEKAIIPSGRPYLIHAQNTNLAGIIAYYIYKKYKIPYIITEHHHLSPDLPKHLLKDSKLAMKNAKTVCFVSEWQLRTYLLGRFVFNDKVIGNLVDNNLFFIDKNKSKDDLFRIVSLVNDLYYKDFDTLVKTIQEFLYLSQANNVIFMLIGVGNDNKILIDKRLTSLGLSKYSKVYGGLPREEISEILRKSHVFLSTSRADSFGIMACEAMMAGIPVVSTNNGGFDEMYVPNINGIKCKISDARGLAKAILSIYTKETIFTPEKIRNSVLSKFGKHIFKEKMLEVYNDAVN